MTTVNRHDAKTQLSKLVEAAEHGETVIIVRNGRPAARLCALEDVEGQWSPQALAFFAAPATPELADFTLSRDDLPPPEDRELF
ncbi:type II toxin-antitoxin system Phd/YefM family antitoxin [Deinococcus frigens]|uniref:type II toxin-antitoxin system Phd/YefM family antitoxin n=1 Tax=Deinococcus frigens TaxID=249403 RepID=UPI000552B72A|nr:type II toxin-antitoxin system prevent-host-death family antitoxin [Deinococcus frigens]